MDHHWGRWVLGSAAVLALGAGGGLLASTYVASKTYRQVKGAVGTMQVTGSARQRIQSDWATWRITVEGRAADLKSAYPELQAGLERVQAFLTARRFAGPEVTLEAIRTETHYKRDTKGNLTDDVTGYTLSRDFVVATGRVQEVEQAASAVTELIRDGVHLSSATPRFTYRGLGELKIRMLGEATKDARTRAEAIAQNSGARVGEVVSAHMGVLQITEPDSTDVSGSGRYDTSTIPKDVTAVVTLTVTVLNP